MIFGKTKVEQFSRTVTKENAEKLTASLQIPIGDLNVTPLSGDQIMEGDFSFSKEKLRPEVNYTENQQTGMLIVKPENSSSISFKKHVNEWRVKLNKEIPLELKVQSGAAKASIDLKGMNISSLHMDMGVGGTTIDLSGDWKRGFQAKLNCGVGKTKIIVPRNIGFKLKTDKGLGKIDSTDLMKIGGTLVNELYEESGDPIEIHLNLGVGKVELELGN
ncbi:toast rack family protein [Pseudalkalibacillus caeni]|uniref:DUF2154 domain-containing protein n=1 Tax=Exobacillus caeni TaxID=2574798 RepID=A0A5R9FFC5_9BACL|nr:toast rack family protein [Pseudalkalibacillus caeni]TLS38275.1 hypothetical protein FCL54_07030 [Pseudalkalibacillus caeni]